LDELGKYNPELLDKERFLVISKSDFLDDDLKKEISRDYMIFPMIYFVRHRTGHPRIKKQILANFKSLMIALIDSITELDRSLFLYFNGSHTPFWDAAMAFFTGTGFWVLFYVSLIYFIIKKYHAKSIVILVLLALAILISDQTANLVKDAVQRLRPTHDQDMQNLVHYVVTRGGHTVFFPPMRPIPLPPPSLRHCCSGIRVTT
jgi:hypothetical protein